MELLEAILGWVDKIEMKNTGYSPVDMYHMYQIRAWKDGSVVSVSHPNPQQGFRRLADKLYEGDY